MDDLIRRYRSDSLTPDELTRLRELMNTGSDEELDAMLDSAGWDSDEPYTPDEERIAMMKRRIDLATTPAAPRLWWMKTAAVAAAVMIPLMVLGGIYVRHLILSQRQPLSYNTVATSGVDNTTVTLADGTVAIMRGESTLRYPSAFDDTLRKVDFSGQGYFDVTPDKHRRFEIATSEMKVEVLGTAFSLDARRKAEIIELALERGRVELTAAKSDEKICLTPGLVARLNTADGHFTIDSVASNINFDWRTCEIEYSDISPDSLINSIEEMYDVTLGHQIRDRINSNFTGTLPSNDFSTVLKILDRIYELQLPFKSREIAGTQAQYADK